VLHSAVGAKRPYRSRLSMALAIVALATVGAASASAELTQSGNLFIRFDGGISPQALPRKALAPIAVRIEGTIKALGGDQPPAARRITIALNGGGRLSAKGLPVCHRRQVDLTSSSEALAACGPALVGAGGLTVRTNLSNQATSLARGEILLFNSVGHGRTEILAHVSVHNPAPVTRVVEFDVHHSSGTYGTVITTKLPDSLTRNIYLKSIFLQLQRRYVFHGERRSYLSADCAAPAGFPGAVFPFARASMSFDDGRTLSSTMTRSCKVR
jgi:hypothetical protein